MSAPDIADQLARLDAQLEHRPAAEILSWAIERFGDGLVIASSFQDCVLIDIATRLEPDVEVVFLDTGAHFAETLDYVDLVTKRYELNLVVLEPTAQAEAWPCGSPRCCEMRKVAPLVAHLTGRQAWATGLRRADSAQRAGAPVISWDAGRGVVKLNPLARWSDADVANYIAAHELPVHPLTGAGYVSIGCAPTTVAVFDGSDARAGRWPGSDKTECGLHL